MIEEEEIELPVVGQKRRFREKDEEQSSVESSNSSHEESSEETQPKKKQKRNLKSETIETSNNSGSDLDIKITITNIPQERLIIDESSYLGSGAYGFVKIGSVSTSNQICYKSIHFLV